MRVALSDPPAAPTGLFRSQTDSTKTAIGLGWTALTNGPAPGGNILGYRIYMAIGVSGSFNMIYDGVGTPAITYQIIRSLTTGELYRFKVSAVTFNTEGAKSSVYQTRSCTAPSVMSAPTRVSSTADTI